MEPISNNDPLDFSSNILKELLDQGYTGDELHQRFSTRMTEMKKATFHIIKEAYEDAQKIKQLEGSL